jgi:hypothetical protein
MFQFLTDLLRSKPRADRRPDDRGPADGEHPERGATPAAGKLRRPALEVLEDRVTPGGGYWSG